jgi:RNA polymerase sigma-70 factor (ECF subfamily)
MSRLDPQSLPKHLDRLYRAAWALCGSPHDAEDLVQETCARVLARPRQLHGQDELAYLMRALRNTFLTQRRTASRRPRASVSTLEDLEPVDPRTGSRPQEALQAREVLATIAQLGDNHRLALVAVDVVGLSYREAAEALGTREATIATRVFRARAQVAEALGEHSGRSGRPARASQPPTQPRGVPQPQAEERAQPAAGQVPRLETKRLAGPPAGKVPLPETKRRAQPPAGKVPLPETKKLAGPPAGKVPLPETKRLAGPPAGKVPLPDGVLSSEVAHES